MRTETTAIVLGMTFIICLTIIVCRSIKLQEQVLALNTCINEKFLYGE